MNTYQNEKPSFTQSNFKDGKIDKSKELNETMSITNQGRDEYESKIHAVQGGND